MKYTGVFAEAKQGKSEKSFWVVLVLAVFVGWLGLHRFYVGKIWTGILFLITGGFLGVGVILDLIMIVLSNFTDKQGFRITG